MFLIIGFSKFSDLGKILGQDWQTLSYSKNVLASRKPAGRGVQFQRPLSETFQFSDKRTNRFVNGAEKNAQKTTKQSFG